MCCTCRNFASSGGVAVTTRAAGAAAAAAGAAVLVDKFENAPTEAAAAHVDAGAAAVDDDEDFEVERPGLAKFSRRFTIHSATMRFSAMSW
jgi:hypothetical protein